MTTKARQLRNLAAGAIVGLASLLPGCASADRTNVGSTGVFQNQTNSTRLARSLTRAYDIAERVMTKGAFTEGTVRYCKVKDVADEMETLGVDGRTFTELYEGQTVQIGWDNPSTPQTPDFLEPPQRISGEAPLVLEGLEALKLRKIVLTLKLKLTRELRRQV